MAVAVHLASRFGEAGKQRLGQRRQRRALRREERAHLLARRAMDARVLTQRSHSTRKRLGQRGEGAAFERVALSVYYAGPRSCPCARAAPAASAARWCRMLREVRHLRVDGGGKPVGVEEGGLQVVDDGHTGDTAEVPKRVLARANERLGVLPPHDLAVALARVAENGAKQMGPAPLAAFFDPGALVEVDLHLLGCRAIV